MSETNHKHPFQAGDVGAAEKQPGAMEEGNVTRMAPPMNAPTPPMNAPTPPINNSGIAGFTPLSLPSGLNFPKMTPASDALPPNFIAVRNKTNRLNEIQTYRRKKKERRKIKGKTRAVEIFPSNVLKQTITEDAGQ